MLKVCRSSVLPSLRKQSTRMLSMSREANDNSTPYERPEVSPVTFEDVSTAMYRVRDGVVRTSCKKSHFLSELCQAEVYLKHEFAQFTGSFKERGARNALMLLTPEEKKRGVIAASAGNHAQALAWHGSQMGIPVTVSFHVQLLQEFVCAIAAVCR
jgi:threonine dehydratase